MYVFYFLNYLKLYACLEYEGRTESHEQQLFVK